MSDGTDTRGFLARWSRLKREARSEPTPPIVRQPSPPVVPATPGPSPVLPPLESLSFDSDFTGFLSDKVSEALRKKALRALFHSPELNVVDGLNDYADDLTRPEPLGDVLVHNIGHWLDEKAEDAVAAALAEAGADAAPTSGENRAEAEAAARPPAQDEPRVEEADGAVPRA